MQASNSGYISGRLKLVAVVSFGTVIPGFSQGIVNNGARIVMTNTSHVYVDGTTGHYKNQNGGLITSGTTGGTITLKGHWTNNASNAAFSNDGVTVRLQGGNQTIGGSNSTTFYNLNLLGSGTKTLDVNTTVGGISTLTGVLSVGARPLDLNSRTLTISNGAASAITYGTGYIISETNVAVNPSIIQWNMGTATGAHVYPFGVSGTQIPFTFNKTTAGASNISVSTRATGSSANTPWAGVSSVAAVTTMASTALSLPDASAASVIDRWWDIRTSAAATGNLVFSYRGSENTTTISPTGGFAAQHWNGTQWDPQTGSGTGVTSGVGTVSVTGASSFSPWVLSTSISGPLPVELTDFSAQCSQDRVELSWTTVSEHNSSSFRVEASRDGELWTMIDLQPAAGNSNYEIEYASTDFHPFPGLSYYRLIQTDNNGAEKLYGPVSVSCGSFRNNVFAFPNPSGGTFSVQITSLEKDDNARMEIFDVSGKLVAFKPFTLSVGSMIIPFDESSLSAGTYTLRIVSIHEGFDPVRVIVTGY